MNFRKTFRRLCVNIICKLWVQVVSALILVVSLVDSEEYIFLLFPNCQPIDEAGELFATNDLPICIHFISDACVSLQSHFNVSVL